MKKEELLKIVEEFKQKYLNTEQGKRHLEEYNREREEVRKIFNEIKEKKERGAELLRPDVLRKSPNFLMLRDDKINFG